MWPNGDRLASRRLFGTNFVVARNPDPDSRLPYLVRLPIDGGLILKVRDTCPGRAESSAPG
ncbi:MAG: hypothetical protein H0X16_04380 [Chloroflexi bacterium]|nr:hypothetical protein [Chloroflexota bacterium]